MGLVSLQVAEEENEETEVFSGSREEGEGLAEEEGKGLVEEEVGRWEGLVKLLALEK